MKRSLILLTVFSFGLLTAACNTTAGAGADLAAGGKKLERTADDNKSY